VKWNASYLSGFTSEKRDQNVSSTCARAGGPVAVDRPRQVEASVSRYDRGVRWEQESLDVHGTRWVSMYLPVWLYSYHQPGKNGGMLHYIAVNGRTGETMGSIPVQQWKLLTRGAHRRHHPRRHCDLDPGELVMSDDGGLALLLLGPAGATGLYWMLYRLLPQHRQVARLRARDRWSTPGR
jgi:hypothetical protein